MNSDGRNKATVTNCRSGANKTILSIFLLWELYNGNV